MTATDCRMTRRCYYHSLDYELRTGQITANINGKIVSVADARQMVARARAQGWLPPEAARVFHRAAESCCKKDTQAEN
jgi:hypothetical protein